MKSIILLALKKEKLKAIKLGDFQLARRFDLAINKFKEK